MRCQAHLFTVGSASLKTSRKSCTVIKDTLKKKVTRKRLLLFKCEILYNITISAIYIYQQKTGLNQEEIAF